MKEVAIQEKLRLMEKEMEILGESMEGIKMDFKEQVALLRIEMDTLKAFLTREFPDFKKEYPRIKKAVTAGLDPERQQ